MGTAASTRRQRRSSVTSTKPVFGGIHLTGPIALEGLAGRPRRRESFSRKAVQAGRNPSSSQPASRPPRRHLKQAQAVLPVWCHHREITLSRRVRGRPGSCCPTGADQLYLGTSTEHSPPCPSNLQSAPSLASDEPKEPPGEVGWHQARTSQCRLQALPGDTSHHTIRTNSYGMVMTKQRRSPGRHHPPRPHPHQVRLNGYP